MALESLKKEFNLIVGDVHEKGEISGKGGMVWNSLDSAIIQNGFGVGNFSVSLKDFDIFLCAGFFFEGDWMRQGECSEMREKISNRGGIREKGKIEWDGVWRSL